MIKTGIPATLKCGCKVVLSSEEQEEVMNWALVVRRCPNGHNEQEIIEILWPAAKEQSND